MILNEQESLSALVVFGLKRGIKFALSPIPLWHYRPDKRTIYLWKDDLKLQPPEFLITALAHELGHSVDFDLHPEKAKSVTYLGFDEVPEDLEISAFATGFQILRQLKIPFPLSRYVHFISDPMKKKVLSLLVNPL